MRSYLLAGNSAHYDGVIRARGARPARHPGLRSGLDDARPAVEVLRSATDAVVDAVVSLTGFSLVGGPAYNDAHAAEETLAGSTCPYLAVMPVEFQTPGAVGRLRAHLLPVEATMMVAIPELDGSTGPMVSAGAATPAESSCTGCGRGCRLAGPMYDMQTCASAPTRWRHASRAGDRAARGERPAPVPAVQLPPNAGATGSAAFLSVFESLFNTCSRPCAPRATTVDAAGRASRPCATA